MICWNITAYLLFLKSFTFLLNTKLPCHCNENEKLVYRHETISNKKVVSVCLGASNQYLVYRYGKIGKVEFTFPQKLDKTSFDKFEYTTYSRGGGPENAAMLYRSLKFKNASFIYEVYYKVGYTGKTEESFKENANITVTGKEKETNYKGDPKSVTDRFDILIDVPEIKNQGF